MREHERGGTECVDGLRGVAVLAVLTYHTWLFSWFTPYLTLHGVTIPVDVLPRVGYFGVDLFFTISGFCLFVPYARAALGGGHVPALRRYALRRALKIVPSYALALVVTTAVALANAQVVVGPELARTLVAHATFLNDYFVDPFGFTNSVFWSLAVEVQFYLLFPILALGFVRRPLLVALALALVAVADRAAVASCCLGNEPIGRHVVAYLDCFGAGMAAAYLLAYVRREMPRLAGRRVVWTIAFVACVACAWQILVAANDVQYVPGGRDRFDVYGRGALALAFGGLLVTGCLAGNAVRAVVANPVARFLSLVSYNLYLWHTLVLIWLWKHGVPHAATPDPHDDERWKFAYIALGWSASFVIATAVTYFVERPILSAVAPHGFAFDWRRFTRPRCAPRTTPIVSSETRT